MGKYLQGQGSVTLADLQAKKSSGEKISVVTCYDAAFARLVDQTNMDMVLVGDSLGNVVLGYDHTIPVTIEDMVYHSRSVARILRKPFLVCDMPFGSYVTPEDAVRNAVRLVQDGGAQAVKLEGGRSVCAQVKKIVENGIPVVGHLGLTPQSLHSLSGYRVQGRGIDAQKAMLEDALALHKAGVAALVLELVPEGLAAKISQALPVPTIGIGAGKACDGQVLVLHDLLGFDEEFTPRFLKRYANIGQIVVNALNDYVKDVKEESFPTQDHSFT